MKTKILSLLGIIIFLNSCIDDEQEKLPEFTIPTTYEFERDGASTVNFQGQTDRLNMLSELKAYLVSGDQGTNLSSQKLLEMYANENAPFEDATLNSSSKQLEDKTNPSEVGFVKELLVQAAEVSADVAENNTLATEGVAGKIERGTSGNFININEKGWEFTQFIEKGLMGSVFYHQIFNVYLSDSKIGSEVDNENLVEGENYTQMEHHWDEAFGYLGVPVDFPNVNPVLPDEYKRFWANYTNGRDPLLGTNKMLVDAYITGRAAITAQNYPLKNAQREIIIDAHELVSAATAVHYINSSMNSLNAGDQGSLFHSLSEAYAFVKALQFSPRKKIDQAQINEILQEDFGSDGDFWTITMEGLENVKNKLTTAYPVLKDVKDEI
ncbi:MAG: DUF4856 domain-containing protein [Anditalea sp.]